MLVTSRAASTYPAESIFILTDLSAVHEDGSLGHLKEHSAGRATVHGDESIIPSAGEILPRAGRGLRIGPRGGRASEKRSAFVEGCRTHLNTHAWWSDVRHA